MDDWYFGSGYGLLLPNHTRKLFYFAKQALDYPADQRVPKLLLERLQGCPEEQRDLIISCACWRYLSMLRTQLKDDLAIYDRISHNKSSRMSEKY